MKGLISFLLRTIPRKYLQLFSHWALRVVALFYIGKRVECPVCGHTFRKFLPYGRLRSRPNALCPFCLSLERHRLLWLYLKERTLFFNNDHKVLHIAPELCFLDHFKKLRNLEYITGDLESPLAMVKMDVHHIPFSNDSFDVVFCNHVMEHVEDDILAMKEIRRVLKPKGWAIMQVPFFYPLPDVTYEDPAIKSKKEREKAFGQDDHVRKYGKDYADRLRSAGFKVTEDQFAEDLPDAVVQRHSLPKNEPIFFCEKG